MTGAAVAANPGAEKADAPPLAGAKFAVAILTALNLLNYVDRYIPSAVKDLFKRDLGLSDAQTSIPLTGLVVVYMLASPIFGSLSDRVPRRVLIAAGVAFWSLATGAAAFAQGFLSFLIARSLIGVGEAAYATISPALLSDFYAPARRNRVLTIFYVAIPVGVAIGFTVGGLVAETLGLGWRAAFMIVGFPGLIASLLVLMVKEPPRGTFDADAAEPPVPWAEAIPQLFRNREYLLTVVGYVAVTFASGALADWFSPFLVRHRGFSLAAADGLLGQTVVVGGLGGTLLGGLAGDWLKGKTRNPYLLVSGGSMALATSFALVALQAQDKFLIGASILLAQVFMWFYNGPINAILVNTVSSRLRVRAFALSILLIHALGDAVSPTVVGHASDRLGLPTALWAVPAMLMAGALIWLYAWRTLPTAAAKAQ